MDVTPVLADLADPADLSADPADLAARRPPARRERKCRAGSASPQGYPTGRAAVETAACIAGAVAVNLDAHSIRGQSDASGGILKASART